MSDKPDRGTLTDWWIVKLPAGYFGKPEPVLHDGEILVAYGNSSYSGKLRHTSPIVSWNKETGLVETENSFYTLVGEGEIFSETSE